MIVMELLSGLSGYSVREHLQLLSETVPPSQLIKQVVDDGGYDLLASGTVTAADMVLPLIRFSWPTKNTQEFTWILGETLSRYRTCSPTDRDKVMYYSMFYL